MGRIKMGKRRDGRALEDMESGRQVKDQRKVVMATTTTIMARAMGVVVSKVRKLQGRDLAVEERQRYLLGTARTTGT